MYVPGICNLLFYFYSICLLWPFRQCCPCSLYKHELGAVGKILRIIIERWGGKRDAEREREQQKMNMCSLSFYSSKSSASFQSTLSSSNTKITSLIATRGIKCLSGRSNQSPVSSLLLREHAAFNTLINQCASRDQTIVYNHVTVHKVLLINWYIG